MSTIATYKDPESSNAPYVISRRTMMSTVSNGTSSG
uniref:Uncharacterized protein n=1 Tax=Acrobeloides nanus TaxID=290746 RepID=A0A914DJK3_9BILA